MVQNIIIEIERAHRFRIPEVDYYEGDYDVKATNATIEWAPINSYSSGNPVNNFLNVYPRDITPPFEARPDG